MAVSLAVSKQYTNMTDTGWTLHDGQAALMHSIARQKCM